MKKIGSNDNNDNYKRPGDDKVKTMIMALVVVTMVVMIVTLISKLNDERKVHR